MTAFHTKHRPKKWETVIGQDAQVKALAAKIEKKGAQQFLLVGPSGTGKTTLARIAAHKAGATTENILEVDAASKTGVDDMRKVQESLQYRAFGESSTRAVIIDECHMLSKNAWNSLLKLIEEPLPHVYIFLCTTELSKVITTVKTRCVTINLKPVAEPDLHRLVERICKREGIELAAGVQDIIVKEAMGSPRQALTNLETAMDAEDRKEAATLLKSAVGSTEAVDLCRFLISGGGSWMKCMGIVEKLKDSSPESVRIILCNYFAKAVLGAKSDKEANRLLTVLDNFATPYYQAEGMAPLLLSIGRTLYAE